MKRIVLAVALLAFVASEAGAAPSFARTRFVKQIAADTFGGANASEADTQAEPHVAVDPNDSEIVVAAVQAGRFPTIGFAAGIDYATSQDGGKTWITAHLPDLTTPAGGPFDRGSDPVVAIGPDGTVYVQTLLTQYVGCRVVVAMQRSDDGGLSFGPPVLTQDNASCSPFFFNDKNWLAVDANPTSPYYGRLYAVWDQAGVAGQPVLLRTSDDRGDTWSSLVDVSLPYGYGGIGAIPLVHPNGDVTVVYASGAHVAQTSHDGGVTFGAPVTIAVPFSASVPGMRTGDFLLSAAIDPTSGDMHAVWQDTRFRGDGLEVRRDRERGALPRRLHGPRCRRGRGARGLVPAIEAPRRGVVSSDDVECDRPSLSAEKVDLIVAS